MTKILVIRLDKLGDSLLSFPFIENLKLNFPDSFLTIIANEYTKNIFLKNKYIDNILVFKNNFKEFKSILKDQKYDISFTLTEKKEGYILTSYLNCPIRVGFTSKFDQPIKTIFFTNKALNKRVYSPHKMKPVFIKHEIERNLQLLEFINIKIKTKELNIYHKFDKRIINILKSYNIISDYIVFVFSSKWLKENTKMSFIVKIINKLNDLIPYPLLVVFSYLDNKYIQDINDKIDSSALVMVNEFWQLADFFYKAKLVITMDSAPAHLASALKLNIVDIFLKRDFEVNSKRWAPWRTKYKILKKENSIEFINNLISASFQLLK